MGKKVREVILLLQMNGWHMDRVRGSHRVFVKKGARSIPVSGKESKDMPEGLYRAILRQANIK
ncbi:MAG: type II toxin-antitoxin system HicA family toxin [Bacteroidales bacterium]|nr:type II toxin-antitoxin system HicA family toxin [Bacteroidales bacterium]MBR1783156.1 type II toxin-antitoxin system HicA family toxin [Bacteroidales bacterium]MBR1783742.1 type II toxin-antitoxin system HicA family toxin [Bacteroidales bacterium]